MLEAWLAPAATTCGTEPASRTGAAILLLGIPARSSPAPARRLSSTHAHDGVAMLLTAFAGGTPAAQAAADGLRPDCTTSKPRLPVLHVRSEDSTEVGSQEGVHGWPETLLPADS